MPDKNGEMKAESKNEKETDRDENPNQGNTASDSTAINPEDERPIDPKMPSMPPA